MQDGQIRRLAFAIAARGPGNRPAVTTELWPQELRMLLGYPGKTVPLSVAAAARRTRGAGRDRHARAAVCAAERRGLGLRRVRARSTRREHTWRARSRTFPTR